MDPAMSPEPPPPEFRVTPRLVVGLAIMLAGLVLALDSLGLVDGGVFFRLWPLALIAIGVVKLMSPARHGSSAIVWIVAGIAFLLVTLGRMSFAGVWALVIFAVGANIAWKAFRPPGVPRESSSALDVFQFMGGTKTVVTTPDFKGGQATAVMGGCEIDLTGSETAGGPAEISAFAMWGGVDIKVPADWEVRMDGSALLGGFVDSTSRSTESGKRKVLTVKGMALMGGVEAKN